MCKCASVYAHECTLCVCISLLPITHTSFFTLPNTHTHTPPSSLCSVILLLFSLHIYFSHTLSPPPSLSSPLLHPNDLTSFLFIQFFKIIKVSSVRHVLHVDWDSGWSVSNVIPICAVEKGVCLQIINMVTKAIGSITN